MNRERNNHLPNYLQTERIPIMSEDVLDIYPRKVVFFPVTGKAMVKRLAHTHPETLVAQEVRAMQRSLPRPHLVVRWICFEEGVRE